MAAAAPPQAKGLGLGLGSAPKTHTTTTPASSSGDAAAYKHDRRCIIYPSYINKNCTVQQGRRIPKELACDAPNVLEIRDVLEKSMMLPCEVEDKSYPRDFWQRGRVRVTIKKEDGSPIAKEFPTRRAVMLEIARLVPMHPGRKGGGGKIGSKSMPTPLEILTQFTSQPGQAGAGAGGSGGGASGSGGGSSKKKGGKKKK